MTKQIILTIGISGSGKSSFASTSVQNNPERYIIIGRDKIRELLYGYTEKTVREYYDRKDFQELENQVTATHDKLIDFWLSKGKIVIVDNTHLRQKYIEDYKKFGANIEIKFFDITLKDALTRNMSRNRKVDEEVIGRQYGQYINLRSLYDESKDTHQLS